ncbi:MAG: aminotransferase class I/II-fold pyridoxal phosphate-dependent enzyme [Planctomycetota bacterium]|nr:aminotransferase class I/II-fold pyridoxal phosphate-dependent enzyme [Planctomycetota bacterium]
MHPPTTNVCVRAGQCDSLSTPPSVSPIFQTSAFEIRDLEHLARMSEGSEPGYVYTREGNPNHTAFAKAVAEMEGAEAAIVAGSGMGAMSAAILAHASSGDHIVAARVLYGRSSELMKSLRDRFGVGVSFVDATDPEAFAAAVQPNTKLAVVESISNPLLEVTDIPALVSVLGNVALLVDNTFTTPCLFRPLEHGARLAFHSASKYLNGHGDVMLGVLAGPADILQQATEMIISFGANANPFECWLAARGLRTLPLRMERVSQTAGRIAEFLATHAAVGRVYYPGLESHGTHDIARRLLSDGFGGMIAFELRDGGTREVNQFMKAVPTIPFSPTLADARTTISHPASTSHKYLSPDEKLEYGVCDALIRLSVGLEDPDLLIEELNAGLRAVMP